MGDDARAAQPHRGGPARVVRAVAASFVAIAATCVVVVLPASVAAAQGAGIVKQLGPPPEQCFIAPGPGDTGCDIYAQGPPDWLYATYYGSVFITGEHLVSKGTEITATAEPTDGGAPYWDLVNDPGITVESGCVGTEDSCTFLAPPTGQSPWRGGWTAFVMDFCGFFGCAPSADYYYVADDPVIEGYVTDASGQPVTSPSISISGATITDYDANTGFYSAIVDPGSYDVTASVNNIPATVSTCSGTTNGTDCNVTVANGDDAQSPNHATVDFVANDEPVIQGTVTNSNGTPALGVSIALTNTACFNDSSSCTSPTVQTGAGGTYSVDVQPGSYTVAPSGLSSPTKSDPTSDSVGVEAGDDVVENFSLTDGPVVSSVQDGAGPFTGGDVLTVSGVGFGSAGSSDSVQFCFTSGTCVAGVSPSVASDTSLTVTTPDVTSEAGSASALPAYAVVTASGVQSLEGPNSRYLFGCTNQVLTAGDYSEGSCYSNSSGSDQYNTTQTTTWDGTNLVSSGNDSADVNTSSDSYASTSPASMQLNLGNSQLVTLLTGVTGVNLNQTPLTFSAAANANIAGFPVTGSVTITSNNKTTMTIATNVKLPTILGGATGMLQVTSVQGTGVTAMSITLASGAQENVAGLFSLAGLGLTWTRATSTWTVSANGTATASPFTLNGNLTYGTTGLTSGKLAIVGAVSLGNGVLTFNNLTLTYDGGAWSASAQVTQATGSLTFSLNVDKSGNLTKGMISSNGPVTLFGAMTLQSFQMSYDGGKWSASATTGAGGQNSISIAVDPSAGGIQSFQFTLQNVTLGSVLTLNKLSLSYSAKNSEYDGSLNVTLSSSGVGVGGSISFVNGAFNSASLNFSGLHVPIGESGVFVVGGSAAIDLTPTVQITGGVQLVFGPTVKGVSAFGASGQLVLNIGNGSTPASIDLTGTLAGGGAPALAGGPGGGAAAAQGNAFVLGNGEVKVDSNGVGTVCVALGPAGTGGCSGSTGLSKFGETITGVLNGTFSPTSGDLSGKVGFSGSLFSGSGGLDLNGYGFAACTSGGTHGFSYVWGGSFSLGCPSSGFSIPTVTSASNGGGDPTTGLNVAAGGTAQVTATGFLGLETVDAVLASTGAVVGSGNADDAGAVAIDATIPADAATGPDELVLEGQSSGLETTLPLMVATSSQSSPTAVEILGSPASMPAGGTYAAAALADGDPSPTYSLFDAPAWLSVDPDSGAISGTEPANGETSFSYAVTATNPNGQATSSTVTVDVVAPAAPTTVTVSSPGTLAQGDAYEASASADGTPAGTFSLAASPAPPSWLSIDPTTGDLTGIEPNDGESSFSYAVVATNASGAATSATVTVEVVAASAPTTVAVDGPSSIDEGDAYVATVDADGAPGDSFGFAASPAPPSWLSIDSTSGTVSGTEPRNGESSFSYAVTATNADGGATSTTVTVTVTPGAAPSSVEVTGPSSIEQSSGYDASTSSQGVPAATYALASSPAAPSWLSIDPATGEVTGTEPGDFESSFAYAVTATNAFGSATSAKVTVDVVTPPVFSSASPPTSVEPGASYDYTFSASGLPDAATYALGSDAPSWLSIDPTTGEVHGTEPDNGETAFTYEVLATNSQGTTQAGPYEVAVDVAPTFVTSSPPGSVGLGDAYTYQFSATGGPDGVTYSLKTSDAGWLSIDPFDGDVTGFDPGGATSFSYSVVASDAEGQSTAGPFTIVNDQAPYLTSDSPPTVTGVSAPYAYKFTADASPDPATFALATTPTPPSWLSINATTGVLSGTEPGNGETSFSFAVTATNSIGSVTSPTTTVSVENLPLFTSDSPPGSVAAGGAYSYQFAAENLPGATGGPTYALTNSPSWLSIDPSTGELSGTEPDDDEATFSFTVEATNSVGTAYAGPFTVDVDLAPVFVDASPPTSIGSNYTDYDYTFQADSTPDPPVYSLSASAPSWLSIDASTGEVTGVEPDGGTAPFTYSVTATNSQGHTTVGPFTVIFGPPEVTSVVDTSSGTNANVFPGDEIDVTGVGLSSPVSLYVGSCSSSSGFFLAELVGSSEVQVNPQGTSLSFQLPGFPELESVRPCADGTIPIDVIDQGAPYTIAGGSGETLSSANDEPADELFYGSPRGLPAPVVTSVTDTSTGIAQVPVGGGAPLTISGSGFDDVQSVTFTDASCMSDAGDVVATVPASDLTVSPDGTTITLTSPSDVADVPNDCGSDVELDVQVTLAAPPSETTSESSVDEPDTLLGLELPTVSSVTDSSTGTNEGPALSGDQLTVTGTNLSGATEVDFVDSACTPDPGTVAQVVTSGIEVSADGTTLTVTSPGDLDDSANACSPGELTSDVVVVVGGPGATVASPVGAGDEYDFDLPNVTAVTDVIDGGSSGPISGGDQLVVTGTDLSDATKITFADAGCMPHPGTLITTLGPSRFTVSPDGTSITLTNPGDLSEYAENCYNNGEYADVLVTVTDPTTRQTGTSIATNADWFNFEPTAAYGSHDDGNGDNAVPAVGGRTIQMWGEGFLGANKVEFVAGGKVLATATPFDVADEALNVTAPNLLADVPKGSTSLTVSLIVEVPDRFAPGGELSSTEGQGVPMPFTLPTVSKVTTAVGNAMKGPLQGGELLTVTGTNLEDATSVVVQYKDSAHATGSVVVQVDNAASTPSTVSVAAPDLGLEVGAPGVDGLTLPKGAATIVTDVRVVQADGKVTEESPVAAPKDQFSFFAPARTAPKFTSVNHATATVNKKLTFTVAATQYATISMSSAPSWLKLTAIGGGAATLSGTPKSSGTYRIKLTAANGTRPNATQSFQLTVSS